MVVLTKEQIRNSEENAVQSGAFSFLELMKKAGDTASEIICQKKEIKNKKIAVVCGNGNNGGDGFVISENLRKLGANVTVIIPFGEPKSKIAKHYFELCSSDIKNHIDGEFDIVIDAIFGIGLDRELNENAKKVINKMNSLQAFKIAVDIPSGIESDSGKVLGGSFNADLTITFIAYKPCFMLPTATDFTGEVVVADIGVNPIEYTFETIDQPKISKRKRNSHKGTFGTALMFCGSYGMAGASILSARACLRSGIGIAKCVMPESIYPIITTAVPEAVCVPLKSSKSGTFKGRYKLQNILQKSTAVLIGCGMANNRHTKKFLKRLVCTVKVPLVIDADGINALVSNINVLKKTDASVILTPHPAEMARLAGIGTYEVEQNRVKVATDFAKEYNVFVVLKGANTLIATPTGQVFFNMCGNAGMATGGNGDVLAGMIVSYLAQGLKPLDALKTSVYLHSSTADMVSKEIGENALIPSDIIEHL